MTEHCHVPYFVSAFRDVIYCDVIDGVDVYGMLLGRLWQFDVGSKHGGSNKHVSIGEEWDQV